MAHDLRLALRSLAAKPAFTALGTLTLALGIGFNAAVFSLLDALYFRPLPLRNPRELVRITRPSQKTVFGLLSYPELLELAGAAPAFSDVVAVGGRGVTLSQRGESRLLIVKYVSPGFFDALGVPVARGRGFRPPDEASQAPLVVVNHQLWQERLGARPDIVGSQVQLNDALFTVIGVTPPGFVGLDRTVRSDVFVLASHARFAVPRLAGEVADRSSRWFEAYARLAKGATLEGARAQLDVLSARWAREDPRQYGGAALRLASFREEQSAAAREGLVFLGLVGLVLLIASANAANLTLARSEGRRREMAIRAALGASRGRLLRQLVLEGLMLSAAGTGAGLLIGSWLTAAAPALAPPAEVTHVLDVRMDGRVLAFVSLLLALTTALVAAVPAWRHSRPDVANDLKPVAAGSARGERGIGARDVIVVGQMAVSVVVLIAAGLLVRSLQYGARLDPGFDPEKRVATFYLVPGLRGYDLDASHRFFEEARRRASALPGVRRASYAIRLPAQGNEAGWAADFVIPGREPPAGEDAFRIRFGIVGPDYFEVLGAKVVRGRGVRETDSPGSAPVAVINRTMAERLWPGEDAVGRHIVMGRKPAVDREIVGVAEDAKIADLYERPEMYVYVPFAQQRQGFGLLLLESAGPPEALTQAVRRQLAELAPGLPVLAVSSLERHRALTLFDERRDAWLGAAVGLLGLALGSVGIYGVVSLVAVRRTKEIGVRVALGARRKDVMRLVLGRGARLALSGAALGGVLGLASTRLLESRLHGIGAADPASFVFGILCLLSAALLASALPALRATRIDPAASIREE